MEQMGKQFDAEKNEYVNALRGDMQNLDQKRIDQCKTLSHQMDQMREQSDEYEAESESMWHDCM
jgi:hypothetical protein